MPVIGLLVAVQVVNGVLLPITLYFVWRLAANHELMGQYANGRTFNVLAGATVIGTSALSLLLLAVTVGDSSARRSALPGEIDQIRSTYRAEDKNS